MGYPNLNEWMEPKPVTQVNALLHLLRVLNLPSDVSTKLAKVLPEPSIHTLLVYASEASDIFSSTFDEDCSQKQRAEAVAFIKAVLQSNQANGSCDATSSSMRDPTELIRIFSVEAYRDFKAGVLSTN